MTLEKEFRKFYNYYLPDHWSELACFMQQTGHIKLEELMIEYSGEQQFPVGKEKVNYIKQRLL